MRVHKETDGVTVHAIAGTYAVHLSISISSCLSVYAFLFSLERERDRLLFYSES